MTANPQLKDSLIQWQGDVPTHWSRAKLFRVCENIGSGGTPATTNQDLYGGDIPWIQSGDLTDSYVDSTEKTITDEGLEKSSAKVFSKGTLLIAMYGATIGKLGIMSMDAAINQACCALDLKSSLHTKFAYYMLFCMRQYLLTLSYGGGQSNISQQIIRQQYFFFPPLPEQKRIAAYLDASCAAIDRAVETKRKQLETLDALRKSIIQRAVTQGLNPKVKMKDSGVEYLGRVPAHWQVSKMKRLLAEPLSYGLNESGTDDNPENPRYIRITDFGRDGTLRDETFRSLPPDIAAAAPLHEGDILLARSGATVGKSFLFSNYKGMACYAGYLIKARTAPHLMLPKYLYLYTRSLSYEAWKDQIFSQATIQNISAVKYAYLETPVPPVVEQEQILEFLDSEISKTADIEKLIRSQITTLTAYRKSLIHECVTGKRRIFDADVAKVEAHV